MDEHSHWHLRLQAGAQSRGPMSANELTALVGSGEATQQAWVRSERVTKGQWVSIMRLPKLAAIANSRAADTHVPPITVATPIPAPAAAPKTRSWLVSLMVGLALVVLLSCGGFVTLLTSLPEPKPLTVTEQATRDASSLCTQCTRRVRDAATKVLKSPATAEFKLECVFIEIGKDVVYEVNGHVDSQNGFGALIRTPVRGVGLKDGRSVQVVEVYLNGQLVLQDKPSAERVVALLKSKPRKDGTAKQ